MTLHFYQSVERRLIKMAMKCIWFFFVCSCYVAGQTSPPTVGVTVTGSTVATLQPTITIAVVKPSNNTSAGTIQAVKEDRFHHCTACPFQSDHHQCNDPFMLDKKFEVSADMCNIINTDKEQIKKLCKRYPKGYFFQCPKDGSSYTCKASCGVQVEDVGKGLLDADITDMPGGLLSGMGLAGNKVNAHEQHPAFGILGGMGNILHPHSNPQLNPFGNRQNANFGQQNSFDSPLLHQQFNNPQQQQFHNPQQQQFHNPQQKQFHIPQQQQFGNQQQQRQFHNPQQQHFGNQQQQFHNPQQQQFHIPNQQQFGNQQQQHFGNPQQQQFHIPQQQQHFGNQQQQFHIPQQQQFENQQQLNSPQHNSMNGVFGNPRQNNFGERGNQFAGPHTSYPGHNPLFQDDNNKMFHSQFMDFSQGQHKNGLQRRQPHLMFENPTAFNNPSAPGSSFERHPRLAFRNPANILSSAGATQSPTNELPTPSKPVPTNIQTNDETSPTRPSDNGGVSPAVQDVQPTKSSSYDPTQAASEPPSVDVLANKPAPTQRSPIESQGPSNSPQVQQVLQASPTPVDNGLQGNQFGAAQPANLLGNFKPINNPFPSAPRHRPLHPYGGQGFMSQPVQKSVSKATSNLHNFMGGFDDFNNGFHGFATDIEGQGHQQARSSGNQGHFMNNIFGFRRRR